MSKKTLDVRLEKKRKKEKEIEDNRTMHAIMAVKMASLLVLRNEGWGDVRLARFSEKFNTLVEDVSNGWLTLQDIADTIYDEVGLSTKDLSIR